LVFALGSRPDATTVSNDFSDYWRLEIGEPF